MFKAKIVVNNNGKQTVLEFDNEQEYYDYLESHPEINQSFNRNWPSFGRNGNWFQDMDKLIDNRINGRLGFKDDQLSPTALVRRDMQRMDEEERRKEKEKELAERRKEQDKKELEEARQLLNAYKQKHNHNADYAKRLEEEIERLEKRLAE